MLERNVLIDGTVYRTHMVTRLNVADKAAFDTNAKGGGSAHSNMQPFAALKKIIRAV